MHAFCSRIRESFANNEIPKENEPEIWMTRHYARYDLHTLWIVTAKTFVYRHESDMNQNLQDHMHVV
jgi:hypothetical protein